MAAVALAITAVAFLAIRTDLQNQVQPAGRRPRRLGEAPGQAVPRGRIPNDWVPTHSSGFGVTYTQVITSAGAVWAPPDGRGLLTPSEAAIDVAAGSAPSSTPSPQVAGTRAMVLTT